MKVKLEQVCNHGSSNLMQKEVTSMEGAFPVYGAASQIGTADFYHQEKPYVAVVKDGAGIGRTMLLPGCSSVIGTLQYLIPKENVLPDYLFYVVQHMKLAKYFSGSTIPHIYFRDYKNEEFNLEPLHRQREIVSTLNKIQRVLNSRHAQLTALNELVKCRFVEMFGDPIIFEKCKHLPQLGEICCLRAGQFVKANDIQTERSEGLYPCFGGNGRRGYVSDYTHDGDYPVIGRQGALCGNVQFVRGKFHATEHAVVVTPRIKMDRCWLYHLLKILNLNRYAIGAAQPGLAVCKLEKIHIQMSDLNEQSQFSHFSRQCDKLRFVIQKSLDETQMLFDSLMQDYFD